MTDASSWLADYRERGHAGPFDLLSVVEADRVAAAVECDAQKVPGLLDPAPVKERWRDLQAPFVWYKSVHIHAEAARAVARLSGITERLVLLLGRELLLWGTELVRQPAGGAHRWHSDLECEGHGVTIWLPLRGGGPNSGLKLMDHSHEFVTYPQELRGTRRIDLRDDGAVLAAARELSPKASISLPEVRAGQFVIFPGRLWHASFNQAIETRYALVFQYSSPEATPRIPVRHEPPLRWHVSPPPVIRLTCVG